jgi:signal transduction histidine kinase
MTIVLALCMGAFALIANSYHQQVLAEAGQIATDSAKAVFGSLEGASERSVWQLERDAPGADAEGSAQLTIVGDVDPAEARKLISEITQRRLGAETLEGGDLTRRLAEEGVTAVGQITSVQCSQVDGVEECVESQRDLNLDDAAIAELFVRVEDIHAMTRPDGVILTIPTLRTRAARGAAADDAGGESLQARPSEIRLPIPVEQYDRLFAGARRRSLFLFLGVFLVGIVLSAGAAARFTRPARKLDAALRELSDGDLESELEVHGDDEMARLGGAFNEMTRKLRANRERTRQLARRDKLSALGRLAAGVAHDVRNPLHSIGLTLDHLHDTGRPDETERAAEFDRSLAMIRGEIRRLDQLVVNFLRFAKGDNRERQSVNLAALVRETAQLVRKETQWRGIEMKLELAEVPDLRIDVEAIRSSLLNLVLNSCEAMPKGGELSISLVSEEGEVRLEVADSGRGIPQDDLEKVFDFGYSTREGGSGLGLVMVHQCVVEEHGGRVDLVSEIDTGTRVQLIFPVPAAATTEESE